MTNVRALGEKAPFLGPSLATPLKSGVPGSHFSLERLSLPHFSSLRAGWTPVLSSPVTWAYYAIDVWSTQADLN